MSRQKINSEKENSVFVRKLRSLFEESGQSQQTLIEFIQDKTGKKMTRQAVSMWLHGNKPDIETLPIIAEFFGVTTDYLLTDTKVATLDIDLRAYREKTGLSEQAVSNLDLVNGSLKATGKFVNDEFVNLIRKGSYSADMLVKQNDFVELIYELAIIKTMAVENAFCDDLTSKLISLKFNKEDADLFFFALKFAAPGYDDNKRFIEQELAEFNTSKLMTRIVEKIKEEHANSDSELNGRYERAYEIIENERNKRLKAKEKKKAGAKDDTLDKLNMFLERFDRHFNRKEDENG